MLRLGFLQVLLAVLTSYSLTSQNAIKIEFEAEPIMLDTSRTGIRQVYRFISDSINYRGTKGVITFPENFKAQDTGYFHDFFVGCENSYFNRVILVLVENYKSVTPRLWVDYNGNLDLSDDGAPIETTADGSLMISHRNSKNPEATFTVKLFRKDRDSTETHMYESFFGKAGFKDGEYLEEVKYWFAEQRLNNRVYKGEIQGTKIRLALHDYSCEGLYTRNGKDRLLVSEDFLKPLSTRVIDGAAILGDTSIVVIGDQQYEIVEIEETGKSIVLEKSSLAMAPPLKIGSSLPNYQVMLDDKRFTLDQLMDGKDYLFVDIWGAWCKGCVSQVSDVKSFEEEHGERISVLGLNHGDSKESKAAFIEEYELGWPNSDLTEEIRAGLNIEGYPTYLLIDKNRKLIMYENGVSQIDQYLKESGE